MKFILESLTSLFVGGLLGGLLWSFGEGMGILGVPGYLIAASFGMLACAWIFIWTRKGDDSLARFAGVIFTAAIIGFPILGFWIGGDQQPVENQFIDSQKLLLMVKWLMIVSLILTMVFSFASILAPLRERKKIQCKR